MLLALLLQTFTAVATPEHPYIVVPGNATATSITVTVRTSIAREFMAANMDPHPGHVTFNDGGSYERVTVRDPLGGILCTQQGSPTPFPMSVPTATPVFATFAQVLGQSTQVSSVGQGLRDPVVVFPVQFQGLYVSTFEEGFVRARESLHPSAEITVTYNQ